MADPIRYEISHAPAYASMKVSLDAGQTIMVEAGAMAAMDPHIKMKSRMKGGLGKGLARLVSGESLFISEFTAEGQPGELYISPGVPGDMRHYALTGNSLIVQSSGFVAASPGIDLDTKFQGLRGFFSGESIFMLRATGTGDFWFSSYGAIIELEITDSYSDYIVDTGYIVAFEDTLNYNVEMMGGLSFKGLKTGILGGEGLVCRFQGKGKLWVQTRNVMPLLNFLYPFRPVSSS